MQAFKFETSVHEDGVIKIPEIKDLVNHEITIFIIPKEAPATKIYSRKKSFAEFSKKWCGFLKNSVDDNWREEYSNFLEEKYQ